MKILTLSLFIFTLLLPIRSETVAPKAAQPKKEAGDTLNAEPPFQGNLIPLEESEKEKKKKNLRFSILGGPGYTPDFGVLLGGSMVASFHAKGMDTFPQRSIIPLAFAVSFGNGIGVALTFRPQLFFNNDNFRIMGQFIYKNSGDNYYGVGYHTNHERLRGAETTLYKASIVQLNPIALFRLQGSHFFIGPMLDIVHDAISNPARQIVYDQDFQRLGGTNNGFSTFNASAGVSLSYDTRDIPANAYKGIYFDLKGLYSEPYWGSEYRFGQLLLDYRQYVDFSKGEGHILSWMFSSKNSFGNVPFTRMPLTGSPFDLRGYYMGQYRDKSSHVAVVEYRHNLKFRINTKFGRLLDRLGFAAWAGSGFMGPSPFEINGILPNFGAGLRIELQPRINFRLDVGYSPVDRQTLLYFNMTEAF